ncbi:MAG: hypothetical protein PVJ92_02490 [Candidatus Dependentiae bacterium]
MKKVVVSLVIIESLFSVVQGASVGVRKEALTQAKTFLKTKLSEQGVADDLLNGGHTVVHAAKTLFDWCEAKEFEGDEETVRALTIMLLLTSFAISAHKGKKDVYRYIQGRYEACSKDNPADAAVLEPFCDKDSCLKTCAEYETVLKAFEMAHGGAKRYEDIFACDAVTRFFVAPESVLKLNGGTDPQVQAYFHLRFLRDIVTYIYQTVLPQLVAPATVGGTS